MFCAMGLLNTTEDSPCNSTPINLLRVRDRLHLEWEERLLIDCSISTKRTGRKAVRVDRDKAG